MFRFLQGKYIRIVLQIKQKIKKNEEISLKNSYERGFGAVDGIFFVLLPCIN